VAHPVEDVADQHAALCGIRLVEHALVAAAVTGDAHKPTREGGERFVERLGAVGSGSLP
jgi:creatinine amidohydrolase/Fe(II)-dependent formamide hydrolase-like protein